MDSGFQAVDSGSQGLDFRLLVSGIWILLVNVIVIPNSLSCQFQIPNSKVLDSSFHKKLFPDSEILNYLLHGATYDFEIGKVQRKYQQL